MPPSWQPSFFAPLSTPRLELAVDDNEEVDEEEHRELDAGDRPERDGEELHHALDVEEEQNEETATDEVDPGQTPGADGPRSAPRAGEPRSAPRRPCAPSLPWEPWD